MTFIIIIFYLLIGAAAGLLGGLLGIGGGLLTVPALLVVFHYLDFPAAYYMQVAIGTSLGAMVFTAASSARAHYQQGGIIWPAFRSLAPGMFLGAILGVLIVDHLSSRQLQLFFGVCECCIGIYFLFSKNGAQSSEFTGSYPVVFVFLGIITGIFSTLLGIGGGIVTVPILTGFRMPLRNAISTSAATGFIIALVGALSFLYTGIGKEPFEWSIGYLYVPAFLCIGLSSLLFAPYGAKLAYMLPLAALKRILGVVLILVGISMMYRVVE